MRWRYGSSRSSGGGSWPRAMWYVEGQGRHSVDVMSMAPLKLPFVPLGRFITQVRLLVWCSAVQLGVVHWGRGQRRCFSSPTDVFRSVVFIFECFVQIHNSSTKVLYGATGRKKGFMGAHTGSARMLGR